MNRTVRLLPVLAIPAVVIAGAVAIPAMASAAPSLDPKRPAEVLALMAKAHDAHFSGTVTQTADLGLPQLPTGAANGGSGSGDSAYSDVLELLSGSHTAKIWVDGATRQRVQVTDQLAERDIIRDGTTAWTWDSSKNAATKLTLPSRSSAAPSGAATTMSPAQLATRIVDDLSGSTRLSVDGSVRVAGRPAYELTLDPTSTSTLVDKVTLAVDSATGVPLSVEVDAVGQKAPAFHVAFSRIDFGRPAASLFSFAAPSGSKVTTQDLSRRSGHAGTPTGSAPSAGGAPAADRPTVSGSGWDSIAIIPASAAAKAGGSATADPSDGSASSDLLGQLTTPVSGGRAVQTSLVSVLFADNGRVLVGAVPVSALEAAAH